MVIGPESLNQGECECLPQKAAVRMKGVNTCKVLRIVPGTGEGLRDFIPSAAGRGLPWFQSSSLWQVLSALLQKSSRKKPFTKDHVI